MENLDFYILTFFSLYSRAEIGFFLIYRTKECFFLFCIYFVFSERVQIFSSKFFSDRVVSFVWYPFTYLLTLFFIFFNLTKTSLKSNSWELMSASNALKVKEPKKPIIVFHTFNL